MEIHGQNSHNLGVDSTPKRSDPEHDSKESVFPLLSIERPGDQQIDWHLGGKQKRNKSRGRQLFKGETISTCERDMLIDSLEREREKERWNETERKYMREPLCTEDTTSPPSPFIASNIN